MDRRPELHSILTGVLGSDNVYFQPPPTLTMTYPCIVYHRDNADTKFADNHPYRYTQRYQVTYVNAHPDSDILLKLARLPMCQYQRYYAARNLNHDVFVLYF